MILKLLFLGDSNVGKSCIIKRYIDDKFDDQIQPTICVEFKIKRLRDEEIKLYIWEITSILDCESIFKNADGVFITFDISDEKSFYNIPQYINEIEKNNKNNRLPPIIILGSKSDCDDEKRQIPYHKLKIFADSLNICCFEISALEEKLERVEFIFNKMISKIKYCKYQNEIKKKKKKCLIL